LPLCWRSSRRFVPRQWRNYVWWLRRVCGRVVVALWSSLRSEEGLPVGRIRHRWVVCLLRQGVRIVATRKIWLRLGWVCRVDCAGFGAADDCAGFGALDD